MSVFLAPIGNGTVFLNPAANPNPGTPANAGQINTYLAGTNTPAPTYTTSLGNVANTNPIILTPAGMAPFEIWQPSTMAYKYIVTDSLLNQIGPTYDNISTGSDAANISYLPPFAGAVATTVAGALNSLAPSVFFFMTP